MVTVIKISAGKLQEECCLRGITSSDRGSCDSFETARDACEAVEDECCECCFLGQQTRRTVGESGCELLGLNTQGDCREVFFDCCLDRTCKLVIV